MPFSQKSQACKEVGKYDPWIGKENQSMKTYLELTWTLEKMTLKLYQICSESAVEV